MKINALNTLRAGYRRWDVTSNQDQALQLMNSCANSDDLAVTNWAPQLCLKLPAGVGVGASRPAQGLERPQESAGLPRLCWDRPNYPI